MAVFPLGEVARHTSAVTCFLFWPMALHISGAAPRGHAPRQPPNLPPAARTLPQGGHRAHPTLFCLLRYPCHGTDCRRSSSVSIHAGDATRGGESTHARGRGDTRSKRTSGAGRSGARRATKAAERLGGAGRTAGAGGRPASLPPRLPGPRRARGGCPTATVAHGVKHTGHAAKRPGAHGARWQRPPRGCHPPALPGKTHRVASAPGPPCAPYHLDESRARRGAPHGRGGAKQPLDDVASKTKTEQQQRSARPSAAAQPRPPRSPHSKRQLWQRPHPRRRRQQQRPRRTPPRRHRRHHPLPHVSDRRGHGQPPRVGRRVLVGREPHPPHQYRRCRQRRYRRRQEGRLHRPDQHRRRRQRRQYRRRDGRRRHAGQCRPHQHRRRR